MLHAEYQPLTPPPHTHLNYKKFQYLFVGGICERKCIIPVVSSLKSSDWDFQFNIVGTGELVPQLLDIIENDKRFNYLGKKQPEQVHTLLEYSDCLVLPSSFDGWGAVVNEALLHGCRCIVSDHAGSHSLIKRTGFGSVFPSNNWNKFKELAGLELAKGKQTEAQRERIKSYSKSIEPESVANYLMDVINFYFGDNQSLPQAPWKIST